MAVVSLKVSLEVSLVNSNASCLCITVLKSRKMKPDVKIDKAFIV